MNLQVIHKRLLVIIGLFSFGLIFPESLLSVEKDMAVIKTIEIQTGRRLTASSKKDISRIEDECTYILNKKGHIIALNLDRIRMGKKDFDLNLLKQLRHIETLYLGQNRLNNLRFLQHMTSLKLLNLRLNNITDLSPLKNLIYLKELDLERNPVRDLSPLSHLINLEILNLKRSDVSDLSSLKPLNHLTRLILSETGISKISSLTGFTHLKILDLGNTDVTDFSALKPLIRLKSLGLSGTRIENLKDLKGLKSLTSLNLAFTKVSDISPLRGLTNLKWLWMHQSMISILPAWIVDWNPKLDLSRVFSDCHLLSPPRKILLKGREAIRTYYLTNSQSIKSSYALFQLIQPPEKNTPPHIKYKIIKDQATKTSPPRHLPLDNWKVEKELLTSVDNCLGGLKPSYPIILMSKKGLDWESYNKIKSCFNKSPYLVGSCINYLIKKNGVEIRIDSKQKFKKIFAPVEDREEALAFAYALCELEGNSILYNLTPLNNNNRDFKFFRKEIRPTSVKKYKNDYVVFLTYFDHLGSVGVEKIILVTRSGEIQILRDEFLFKDRTNDGLYIN